MATYKPQRLYKKYQQFSQKLICDIRALLWVVTVGGLILAFYCVHKGFVGSLPWIGIMVGLPWSAHGVVCSFYLNLCKSDHSQGGITFETAKAQNFGQPIDTGSVNSPSI